MKSKVINSHPRAAICCDNLKIGFGKKKNSTVLIENFTFDFKKGKVYGIIGNSGIGKTTLVSHFNGLYRTISGNIFVNDLCILANKKRIKNIKKIRKEIGFVFQLPQTQLFKETVESDVAYGPKNLFNKKHAHELACAYLRNVGIKEDLFCESPFMLSFGQQRRTTIAGCLAIEPSVFIFDEPTAGLDPTGIKLIINLIKKLRKEDKTIILISHDMDLVLELCDEVILLHEKKVVVTGTPYKVFMHPYLAHTHMLKPFVLQTIDLLSKYDRIYESIYKLQPRTIEELSRILKHFKRLKGGR